MKAKIIIVSAILCVSVAFGQAGKLKKADKLFERLSYSLAVPKYESLDGSEVDSPKMKAKLAYCYYAIGETQKAESTYSKMISTSDASVDDYFYYAQALKQNGKYSESDQWMSKVNATSATDMRGLNFAENKNYVSAIQKQGERFSIQNLNINTAAADFGTYPDVKRGKWFFVSNRRKRVFVQNKWSWNNNRFLDLYAATPEGVQLKDQGLLKKKVNSRYHEGPLTFTTDGNRVYFTRNNLMKGAKRRDKKGIQNLKMFYADVNAEGSWTAIKEITFNSKDYSVGHPTITADGKTMYFASDMPGTLGGADIWKCAINADGSLGTPENLGKEVNTEGHDMFPWMDTDGNLFYSSNGQIGLGGLDVFRLQSNGKGGFDKPFNVGLPVNGPSDDFAFVMSNDGKTGYFSSNRTGGKGDDDIYSFTLLKPFKRNLTLVGIAREKGTGAALANTSIELVASNGTKQTVITDSKGAYSFPLEEDLNYTLNGKKTDYFDNSVNTTSKNIPSEVSEINKDIDLDKDPGLSLYALVTDSKTNTPLDKVNLLIKDNKTGESFIQTVTPTSGDAFKGLVGKKVGDELSYTISVQKDGYFPKEVQFNYKIQEPGIVKVHEKLAGSLSLDKEVSDLRDLVQINDIRFDLNKYNIRPDAATELDKVVAVMNKYPDLVIELGSHTDCRSSYAYNEKLSDNRAKASAAYIKARITKPERIYGKGYGEKTLLNTCACEGAVKSTCTEDEHQKNRRTEFKVISAGGANVINNSTDSFKK